MKLTVSLTRFSELGQAGDPWNWTWTTGDPEAGEKADRQQLQVRFPGHMRSSDGQWTTSSRGWPGRRASRTRLGRR